MAKKLLAAAKEVLKDSQLPQKNPENSKEKMFVVNRAEIGMEPNCISDSTVAKNRSDKW